MPQKHFCQLFGFCLVWLLGQALAMASRHTWGSRQRSLGLKSCMSILPLGSQACPATPSPAWTLNPTLPSPSAMLLKHLDHDPSSACQVPRVETGRTGLSQEGGAAGHKGCLLPASPSPDPYRVRYANVRRRLCLQEYEVEDTISAVR